MIAPIAIFALAITAQQPPTSNPCAAGFTENVWDPRFTPGQRWSYRARPIDKGSTLTITKIDYVPELGLVVHILVDHVDFEDKPGDRPFNNNRRESFAMRRDSLDASVLEMLGIAQVAGFPSNYYNWKINCGALTYGTTVADTLKSLQEAYLAKQYTFTTQISLAPVPPGKLEKLSLTLSQRIIDERYHLRELQGHISFKGGSQVKNAHIEITSRDSNQRAFTMSVKTDGDGTFLIPMSIGTYDFRLTLNGFQSITGTLSVSARQPSLSNLRSEP